MKYGKNVWKIVTVESPETLKSSLKPHLSDAHTDYPVYTVTSMPCLYSSHTSYPAFFSSSA